MNVLDFLKGNFHYHVGSIGAEWTPRSPRSDWNQGGSTSAGVSVNSDTALNSATAFACTRARAETLATLPAIVYENMDADQRQKARDNPMWALLHDQPNPQMDSVTWYSLNGKRLINRGNSLSLVEFNGRGIQIALWPVHNSRWEAHRGPSILLPSGRFRPGDLFYRIWPDDSQRWVDVGPDDVLNIVGFDTENGVVARGVPHRLKQEIGLDIAQQEYAGSMFKNGAIPLGLIKHPWIDDEEQRDNFRADINGMHSGRENWNRVGILWDKDADWKNLNFNPKDVQAVESRAMTSKVICRGYNVPPAIVQIFDDYKFSTVEAMLKQFVMLTVRPDAVCFERAIKTQLLTSIPGEDVFLEFALEGLLRGDPKAQAEANAILRQWGALNVDEWRQRDLNMNPLPGGIGQAYLAPINFAPLERVISGQAMQKSEPAREPEDAEPETRLPKWDKGYVAALMHVANGQAARVSTDQFAWKVIRSQAARMIDNELRAIRRQVKDHGSEGFGQWAEDYYGKFAGSFSKAIQVGCEGLPGDAEQMAMAVASAHCRQSTGLLLAASQSVDFPTSIEACIADWPQRAETIGATHERAAA